jgi:lysozyme
MKTSQNGIDLIKSFEGCRLKAYKCPAGILTIGIGRTGTVNGKPITADMTITELMAETLLAIDLQKFEKCINDNVKKPLTQNEFDALVSFVFNVGTGAFEKSSMLKLLNSGHMPLAAGQFDRWIYAKGKVLNGLKKRRAAEKALFLTHN